jgi:hypothetical protein
VTVAIASSSFVPMKACEIVAAVAGMFSYVKRIEVAL